MIDLARARRVMLRSCCAIAGALATPIAVLGFCPGAEHYYPRFETSTVAGEPLWVLGLLGLMLAPGVLVWRRPALGPALLWSMASVGFTAFVMPLTVQGFDPEGMGRILWTTRVYEALLLSLVMLQLAVLPLVSAGLALAEWRQRQVARSLQPERIATARVHRIRRA